MLWDAGPNPTVRLTDLAFSLDLRKPESRRIHVTLEFTAARGQVLALCVWTPGSYLVREFARFVGDVTAKDASGNDLSCRKISKNRYQIDGPADRTTIRYTVYAHELTVRTNDLTTSPALIQGAATFLWPIEEDRPAAASAQVQVLAPQDWQICTSLPEKGPALFEAASLDELVDCPILAGTYERMDFQVQGKPHAILLQDLAPFRASPELVADTASLIAAAAKVFGGSLPYDRYEFLSLFADQGRGGLEHNACSVLLAPRTTFETRKDYQDFMGLVSHEFFHVWNVKRMRPATLWDFDYEAENYTDLLWVAEGFTAYYDDLLCLRVGILEPREYLDIIARHITDLRRTPGRLHHSLAASSFDAWIRLYRPSEDTRNTTLSYYGNGALAALLIDLRIRSCSNGTRSLDDAIRMLFETTFLQGRGYTEDDVLHCLSETAGTSMSEFVRNLVHAPFDPDFTAPLGQIGVDVTDSTTPRSYLGIGFRPDSTNIATVRRGSPAELAGLAPGDEVLAIGQVRVRSNNWQEVFELEARNNKQVSLLVSRRGLIETLHATPGQLADDKVRLRIAPSIDEETLNQRKDWLGA